MANFLDTEELSLKVMDDNGDQWQQAEVKFKIKADGTIQWKLHMTNDHVGSMGRAVAVYLKFSIMDPVYNTFVTRSGTNNSDWKKFPTGHDTWYPSEGYKEIKLANTNTKDVTVRLQVSCMRNPFDKDHPEWLEPWENYEKYNSSKHPWKYIRKDFTRSTWESGTVSTPTISYDTSNKTTIKCSIADGKNNAFKSAKLYYTTDGSDPTVNSSSKDITSKSITVTINTPSGAASSTVKARVVATFTHGADVSSTTGSGTVKHYSNGTKPAAPTITDNGDNTFKITGSAGGTGHNNSISTAQLCYTINGGTKQTWDLLSKGTTTSNISITEDSTVKAWIERTMSWSGASADSKKSAENSKTILYHTPISGGSINILENLNNTFTITAIACKAGTNNEVTNTVTWGYTKDYKSTGTTGSNKYTLEISSPASPTRMVYAKLTAKPSWSMDSTKVLTVEKAIKQYVAPKGPDKPFLSYNKNRLTVKEPWTFTWSAATQTNSSSPVKGYYLMLKRCPAGSSNFEYIREITASSSNNYIGLNKGSNSNNETNYYVKREGSSCTAIIKDPVSFGFAPGDKVQLILRAFTTDGLNKVIQGPIVSSPTYTVQNAGIVRVKVGGAWKEGQVYVKVNGAWKEAETVNVKVGGQWKESQ